MVFFTFVYSLRMPLAHRLTFCLPRDPCYHIWAIFIRFFILFLFHFYTRLLVVVIIDEMCRHVNNYRNTRGSQGCRWRLSPFFLYLPHPPLVLD